MLKNKTLLILSVLVVIGSFLRFYNLDWGAPYYFHPDERNIASSVSQLQFPSNMNPHFFAYGTLPIYSIYFVGLIMNSFSSCHLSLVTCLSAEALAKADRVSFEDAILIGRTFSALFSLLLIPLVFLIGKRLHSEKTGLLAATLITFSTGLIQYAHFATFELWTTFFSVLLLLLSLREVFKPDKMNILAVSVVAGILIAIKATNILLLPIPFIAIGIGLFKIRKKQIKKFHLFGRFLVSFLFVLLITSLIFLLTNPFVFLAMKDFLGTMQYESGVALGTLPVFYTGEFYRTIPILFQLLKVFPFLLNPLLTVLGVISFFYGLFLLFKKRSPEILLLVITLSVLLFPQAFFFVKWTRYMVPTIPFFIVLGSLFLMSMCEIKKVKFIANSIMLITVAATLVFGASYFVTAFVEKDTRVAASLATKKMFPGATPILSEMYDMGIVAFNEHFSNIILFNFYDLDSPSPESSTKILNEQLPAYEYLILPSQRILATRTGHKEKFPQGYLFYQELQTDKQKFQKIYETPCTIFCQITYLGDQVFRFEGTANSFDRPPLQIYKIIN